MKQSAIIVFSVFYLLLSMGIRVDLHYCHGKLSVIKINQIGGECCCGDRGLEKGCCEDQKDLWQLDTEQLRTHNSLKQFTKVVEAIPSKPSLEGHVRPVLIQKQTDNYSLPPPTLLPLYITQSRLLFYG